MQKIDLYKLPKDILIEIILKTYKMSPVEVIKTTNYFRNELKKMVSEEEWKNHASSVGISLGKYGVTKSPEDRRLLEENLDKCGINKNKIDELDFTNFTALFNFISLDNFNHEKYNKPWIRIELKKDHKPQILNLNLLMYPDPFPVGFVCYDSTDDKKLLIYILPDWIEEIS